MLMRALFWASFAALILVRVPSLAQPAGADQSLYAYVGQRILAGEMPYRDAWDQKPPAIHYTYALMYAVWPRDAVVPATDLLVAGLTGWLILLLGRRLAGPGAGMVAALLFLAYTNPALTRLGGVRIRAQCEVFIALFATLALFIVHRTCTDDDELYRRGRRGMLLAGALFGVVFFYKYNAGIYLVVGMLATLTWSDTADEGVSLAARVREAIPRLAALIGGFAIVLIIGVVWFWSRHALRDLWDATIGYNLFYSGETYANRWQMVTYLVTFPVQHARLDALWFLGGLGAAWLTLRTWRSPRTIVPALWVAAACLTIAVNGSRGLPQYFLQAGAPLALAAAVAFSQVWPRLTMSGRTVMVVLLAIGAWRITSPEKAIDYTGYDLKYLTGAGGGMTREQYLSRFGERASDDKYSALAVHELAQHLAVEGPTRETVLLFGFSPGALVQAHRVSATRFFWSRPIIVGFNTGKPGYGVNGMLDELARTKPVEVVLQRHDWDPDGPDSASFFFSDPRLIDWLRENYEPAGELGNFLLFRRKPDFA
jgi:4-amino-4-deoxy-L-arabinose transferase-like glycosyltransferase